MKYHRDPEKDSILRDQRHISFQMIVDAIEDGKLLGIENYRNQEKYSHQQILVVDIDGYPHAVPVVWQDDENIFLKTIYKDRVFKKLYYGNK